MALRAISRERLSAARLVSRSSCFSLPYTHGRYSGCIQPITVITFLGGAHNEISMWPSTFYYYALVP